MVKVSQWTDAPSASSLACFLGADADIFATAFSLLVAAALTSMALHCCTIPTEIVCEHQQTCKHINSFSTYVTSKPTPGTCIINLPFHWKFMSSQANKVGKLALLNTFILIKSDCTIIFCTRFWPNEISPILKWLGGRGRVCYGTPFV